MWHSMYVCWKKCLKLKITPNKVLTGVMHLLVQCSEKDTHIICQNAWSESIHEEIPGTSKPRGALKTDGLWHFKCQGHETQAEQRFQMKGEQIWNVTLTEELRRPLLSDTSENHPKNQPFQVSGNGPNGTEQIKTLFFFQENLLKLRRVSVSQWYVN